MFTHLNRSWLRIKLYLNQHVAVMSQHTCLCHRYLLGELWGRNVHPDSVRPHGSAAGGWRSDAGAKESPLRSHGREGQHHFLSGCEVTVVRSKVTARVLSSVLLLSAGLLIKLCDRNLQLRRYSANWVSLLLTLWDSRNMQAALYQ